MAFMNPSFGGAGLTDWNNNQVGPNANPQQYLQDPFVGRRYPGSFDEFMQTVPQNEGSDWETYFKALTTDPNLGFADTSKYYDLAEAKARADSKALSMGEAGESGVAPGGGPEREMMSRRYGDIALNRAGAESESARQAANIQAQTRLAGASAGYGGTRSTRNMRENNYFTNLARQNVQQAGVDIGNVQGGRANIPTALSYGAAPSRTPSSGFGSLGGWPSSTPSAGPSNKTPWWQTSYGEMNDGEGAKWNKTQPGGTAGVSGTGLYPSDTNFTGLGRATPTYASNVNNPAGWPELAEQQKPRTNSPYYT